MNIRKIGWASHNYDMGCDEEKVEIEEPTGNRGLGVIVAVMTGLPLCLIVPLRLSQMAGGNVGGNPVGELIAATLLLGWPALWGIRQICCRRRFHLGDGVVHFEFIGLFGSRKRDVQMSEYGRLVYGRTQSQSRFEGGVGQTSFYFVEIRHSRREYTIRFYRNVREQMREDRICRYADLLGLSAEDCTPERSSAAGKFEKKARAFVEERERQAAERKGSAGLPDQAK